jgi:hypothetical protein
VLGDAGGRDALLATLGAGSSAGGAGMGGLGRLSAGTSRQASHAPGTGERQGAARRGRTATAESESLESLGESEHKRRGHLSEHKRARSPRSRSPPLERGDLEWRGETAGSEEVPGGLLARLGRGASVAGSERASTGGGAGALRFEGMRVEAGRRGDRGDSEALMPARVSIPQEGDEQEVPDIEGRMDRHGNRVAMPASDDVDERREALLSLGDARGVGVPDPDAAGRRASTTKTPKKVLFDLERERARDGEDEDEGDAKEHDGFQNMMRVDSRPTTGASTRFGASRPTTGASSFRDQDSERGSPRGAPKRAEDVSAEEEQAFFSLVRHNKVPDVEAALEEGFPIDKRDAHGNTTLMVAAQNGHKRLAKMALKHGADPNSTNHQGNTALHFATSYGYSALSKYLIAHGADDTLMNMKGLTCYDGIG